MQLSTFLFLCFFIIVFCVNYLLPSKFRWIWLFIASLVFCSYGDIKYTALALIIALAAYGSARFIGQFESRRKKTIFLVIGLTVIIGALFSFKYLGFFLQTVKSGFDLLGVKIDPVIPKLILPLGISFYSFQTIAYLIDVYNGVIQPEQNIGRFALFVLFFPKFISGPIERGATLLPQLYNPKPLDYERFLSGFTRIIWGFFKKLVIADRLAVIVNSAFNQPGSFYGPQLALAVLAFSFQIYIDFSAYCDIAIGAARLLGIDLTENFNAPYFALSVTEFWRRWHISLTNWLRDYIFIPLNFATRHKRSKIFQYINIMIVFLVSGIWHGANWTFIVWGLLHGFYQVVEAATQKTRNILVKKFKIDRLSFGHKFWKVLLTFGLVTLAWIFFRANSLSDALHIIRQIVTLRGVSFPQGWDFLALGLSSTNLFIVFVALIIFWAFDAVNFHINLIESLGKQPLAFRWFVYLTLIFAVILFGYFGNYTPASFIYGRF